VKQPQYDLCLVQLTLLIRKAMKVGYHAIIMAHQAVLAASSVMPACGAQAGEGVAVKLAPLVLMPLSGCNCVAACQHWLFTAAGVLLLLPKQFGRWQSFGAGSVGSTASSSVVG
jgi:hypothetical protein